MGIKFNEFRKAKKWIVTWRNPWTGKKHTRGFDEKCHAEAFESAQAELAAREKILLKKARKKKQETEKIRVNELMEKYFRLAHSNPVTIRQTQYHANHIISVFGSRLVSQLTPQDVFNFSEAQLLRGIAQTTVNRRVGILRAALNWGVRNGLMAKNPLHSVRLPKGHAQRIAPPSMRELRQILDTAAPHVKRVIILGLYAGPRIGPSELFRLEWKDVDLQNAVIRMPGAKKNYFEDGRDVPIRSGLIKIMTEWEKHDLEKGISTVISWGGKPVRSISRAWHTALAKAGIMRRIRPYDLRHAFATYALAGSADIGSVASIMGHTDASMILKTYQHVQDSQKRMAVEAAPDLIKFMDMDARE